MSFYDTLVTWYLHADRRKHGSGRFDLIVPDTLMQQAIREAAKWENRESEQWPFETGDEWEARCGTTDTPTTATGTG